MAAYKSHCCTKTLCHEISGDTDGKGHLIFDAKMENQGAALLLSGGFLHVAFASHFDIDEYHGWVLAYDAATGSTPVVSSNGSTNEIVWILFTDMVRALQRYYTPFRATDLKELYDSARVAGDFRFPPLLTITFTSALKRNSMFMASCTNHLTISNQLSV